MASILLILRFAFPGNLRCAIGHLDTRCAMRTFWYFEFRCRQLVDRMTITSASLNADQRIFIISDMHIGDGTRMDLFANKDDLLIDFLAFAKRHADVLIIAGDGFDLCQAWSLHRIWSKHQALMEVLRKLATQLPIFYIQGNHDGEAQVLAPSLPFHYHSSLWIGDAIYVEHGHQYDPYCQPDDPKAEFRVRLHALFERVVQAPLRIPMRKHYGWSTRIGHWLFYRYGQWQWLKSQCFRLMGCHRRAQACIDFLDYFGRGEWGEMNVKFQVINDVLATELFDTLICGHSHQAGKVKLPGGLYVNSGSWTFDEAIFVDVNHGAVEVKTWPAQRCISDEQYRGPLGPHRHKSFFDWWEAFYLGWLRYDVEAMHRAIEGELLPGDQERVLKR